VAKENILEMTFFKLMPVFNYLTVNFFQDESKLFSRDLSRCFTDIDSAIQYLDELTARLKLLQGVPKVVTGEQGNTEVVPEDQFV
jgi:hypothetical protein